MGRKITALKRYLTEKGIDQAKLAKLTNLSAPRISRLSGGIGAPPSGDEITKIVEALNCLPEEVFPFSGLSYLPQEEREKELLCQWLKGDEGSLVLRRIKAIVGDAA